MSEQLIGYGYTNSQGVATLDYDANGNAISGSGYTGTGAGVLDLKAKLHDDSSVVSQPYTVWDTIYNDIEEVTASKNYDQTIGSDAFAFEFDVNLSSNSSQVWFRIGTDASNCYVIGVLYQDQQGIRVRKNGSYTDSVFVSSRLSLNTTVTIKFTYNNGVLTYSDDDETVTLSDSTVTPSKLIQCSITSATLSNLKLYNI